MCLKCNEKSKYKNSNRIHKRPPRVFVDCLNCGATVQAVLLPDGSVHEFSTNRKKADSKTLHASAKYRPSKAALFRKLGGLQKILDKALGE